MQRVFFLVFIVLSFSLSTLSVLQSKEVKKRYVSFDIISQKQSVKKGSSFHILIKAKMDKTWHIYWKNPGDGGRETKISLSLPSYVKEEGSSWQYPSLFRLAGFISYGYEDEVYFLYKLKLLEDIPRNVRSLKIAATVDYLICSDVCLPPNKANLSTSIKIGEDKDNPNWNALYSSVIKKIPKQISTNISLVKAEQKDKQEDAVVNKTKQIEKALYMELGSFIRDNVGKSNNVDKKGSKLYFFAETKELIKPLAKQKSFTKDGNVYLKLRLLDSFSKLSGVIVFYDKAGGEAKSFYLTNINLANDKAISLEDRPGGASNSGLPIWLALVFAFIGGLILNLMPCVLPVLSLKVISFAEQSGQSRKSVRLNGIVFTLGVLLSLWVLVFFLVFLKEVGGVIGWGYQLQDSLFIMFLGFFFLIFALNLFGLFEIGVLFTRVGNAKAKGSSLFKSFITGILITISATPCSAPFLGTAIGFTIAQQTYVIFFVFTFIGIGLSFPYLLLSFFPSMLRFLPKPGNWMLSFKQFMGFLLLATVGFLIWVLGKQSDIDTVFYYLLSLIIMSIAFWIYGRWFTFARKSFIALSIALLLLGTAFFLSYSLYSDMNTKDAAPKIIEWKAFDPALVDKLRKQGKPVFIDFTAAWCLTCQTNKIALHSKEVETRFKELGITTFVGDWTKKDEAVGKALKDLGRAAVPVYVFYRADGETVLLPDLLTTDIILSYLE